MVKADKMGIQKRGKGKNICKILIQFAKRAKKNVRESIRALFIQNELRHHT